ncbi:protein of unknown function [Microbacterium sp. Nx66]|nr:protein of unknown function [Microbacterium sp. Nx66]
MHENGRPFRGGRLLFPDPPRSVPPGPLRTHARGRLALEGPAREWGSDQVDLRGLCDSPLGSLSLSKGAQTTTGRRGRSRGRSGCSHPPRGKEREWHRRRR